MIIIELKKCPYCAGYTKIVEFNDFSGHIQCTGCYETFEGFGVFTYSKEQAVDRFNKYIGK